jgi:hypothetical protein
MKISADTFCKIATGRLGDWTTGRLGDSGAPIPPRLLVLFLLLSGLLAACGKIGDPKAPLVRAPLKVDTLSVEQRGAHLSLKFPFNREPRAKLQRIDVYRLLEPLDAPMGLPIETFSERSSVVYSILADDVPIGSSDVGYNDPLNVKSDLESKRYRYAVQVYDADGRGAGFSNYAMIQPLLNLALPPGGLTARQVEKQVEITWDLPSGNMNETYPANVVGYNIYRRQGGGFNKINAEPLREPRFIDRDFQFGVNYHYVVRSLSFKPGSASLSELIESDDSSPLEHRPKDTFPPTPPHPITIASINGIVSLFWPLSAEPDVVGYNIYRTQEEGAPLEKWVKINPELHKTASFRDDHAQVEKKYFYQITAVDASGNESVRSETVSETVVR